MLVNSCIFLGLSPLGSRGSISSQKCAPFKGRTQGDDTSGDGVGVVDVVVKGDGDEWRKRYHKCFR